MSIARRRSAVTALVAVAALLLGACGGDSEQLEALKDDPFARYEPPSGRLVDSGEESEGTSLLGKPVNAEQWRLFELPAGDPERQLEHAVDAAAAAGWAVDDDRVWQSARGNLVQSGERRLATGRARMSVTVFPRGAPSQHTGVPAMLIRLQHFS